MVAGVATRQGIRSLVRTAGSGDNPPSGQSLIYPKTGVGWVSRDSAGVETPLGAPVGTKVSALSAAGTLADTDKMLIVNGGASKYVDLTALTNYFESRGRVNNASVTQQTWGGTEAYLTGSYCLIPAGRLQAKTKFLCRFYVAKTSVAGVATPIINVKIGTAGTTADTTRAALTFAAQTAVADTGRIDVEVTFRTVGSGTSAVIRAQGTLDHTLAATGLSTSNTSIAGTTSSGFDSTVASIGIGLSVNWGTSFVGTTDLAQAELLNLA